MSRTFKPFVVTVILASVLFSGCGGDSFTVESDHGDQSSSENEGASISISANSADGGTVISSREDVSHMTRQFRVLVARAETATFCLGSVPPMTVVEIVTPGHRVVELSGASCELANVNPGSILQVSAPVGTYREVTLQSVTPNGSMYLLQAE